MAWKELKSPPQEGEAVAVRDRDGRRHIADYRNGEFIARDTAGPLPRDSITRWMSISEAQLPASPTPAVKKNPESTKPR